MVALANVAVGGKVTAATENAEILLLNTQMGTNIIPTSVSGGSIGTDGKVTFSATTAIGVNGCFTSTYDTYMVFLDVSSKTNATDMVMRLRLANSPISTATYTHNRNVTTAANTVFQAISSTSFIADGGALATSRVRGTYTFVDPFQTVPTSVYGSGISTNATPGNLNGFLIYGDQTDTTAYDGFSFSVTAGTITGVLRVVGLNTGV